MKTQEIHKPNNTFYLDQKTWILVLFLFRYISIYIKFCEQVDEPCRLNTLSESYYFGIVAIRLELDNYRMEKDQYKLDL